MRKLIVASSLFLCSATMVFGQDPGWPRQIMNGGNSFVFYQPQIDEWKDFTDVKWRMAFSMTPAGAKPVIWVLEMQGHTDVDNDNKVATITNLTISRSNFPSLDPATTAKMDQLVTTFVPPAVTISLHRLVASTAKPDSVPGVPLNNDPPAIVVSNTPAILLAVDGEPSLAEVPNTKLEFVVNTTWPLFFDKSGPEFYLLIGQRWVTATTLDGPWLPTVKLPKDMTKLVSDPEWMALKSVIPPPAAPSGAHSKASASGNPATLGADANKNSRSVLIRSHGSDFRFDGAWQNLSDSASAALTALVYGLSMKLL